MKYLDIYIYILHFIISNYTNKLGTNYVYKLEGEEVRYNLQLPSKICFHQQTFHLSLIGLHSLSGIHSLIVDHVTLLAQAVPSTKTITWKETIKLFLDNIYCYHGFSKDIILDRRIQFVLRFWRILFKILRVYMKLSLTSYSHTHGQI